MISDVRIANMALSHVGAKSTIEAIGEASTEGRVVDLWFEYSRRQTLEAFDWNFARKRRALTTHAEDPPEGVWGFRYVYPGDCLAARKIENPTASAPLVWIQNFTDPETRGDAIPFEVEQNAAGNQKTILTNLQDAVLVYTFEQLDAGLYSPLFVEALSWAVAAHIAFTLTGKRSIAGDARQAFQNIMFLAPAADANERVEKPPREAEWVRGRV